MVVSATITHVMPYLNSIGIPRSTSSLIATAIPLMSIGGRLVLGWLGDKLSRKKVAALGLAMMSLGTLCYANVPSFGLWLLFPFLILFGLGYGGCSVIRPGLAREYFGRSNFGTILGLFTGIAMIGMISGAPLAGWVFDNWGSYQGIWFVFTLLPVIALTLLLTIQETKPAEKS
jgi:MFS family permease